MSDTKKNIQRDDVFIVSNYADFSNSDIRRATGKFDEDGSPTFYPRGYSYANYSLSEDFFKSFKFIQPACTYCGKPLTDNCGHKPVRPPQPMYLDEYHQPDLDEENFLTALVIMRTLRGKR